MTISPDSLISNGFYIIPLLPKEKVNLESKPLEDDQFLSEEDSTQAQEMEASPSLANSGSILVNSETSETSKVQAPQLRNSFFLTLFNFYLGKKQATEQTDHEGNVTLAVEQAYVEHPTLSKLKECFGKNQKISAKQLKAIEAVLKANPEAVAKVDRYLSNFQIRREQILEILARDDGILPELNDPVVLENGMILCELSQQLPSNTEEKQASSNQLLRPLKAAFDQLTCNMQIHTDYFNSGIEEEKGYCIGGAFDRTIQNHDCLKEELAELKKLAADETEPLSDIQKKRLARLPELIESHYAVRDNCQGIEHRCLWEDVVKNEAGGFVSGFRRISFRSKKGVERSEEIPLDLSSLGHLNRKQSQKIFNFLLEFEQKIYIREERNIIQHRLLKEALIDLSKIIQAQLVMGVDFNEIRVFSDKQTELIARLQEVPQSPLPKECQKQLDSLNFLSDKQKDQLVGIAAEFTYRMNRSTHLAYLKLVTD